MKKYILAFIICSFTLSANAQLMRAEELEKYSVEHYGNKWTEAAQNLCDQLTLDKNNSLTYSQVIDCENQSKEQLYIILNYWFTNSFNDANSVIQLNDKKSGTIIASGYISEIAAHSGGLNSYVINLNPIIKVDIKDGKIRVTYTVQYYNVEKYAGGGILGAMNGNSGTKVHEKWEIDKTYPFQKKDAYKAKKSSSKALVMTHAYSNVVMDKIQEAVTNGLVGNENDDW